VVPGATNRIVSTQFDTRTVAMSFPLFTDLDSDWCAVATSQGARAALERWADDPILGGARSLDDLLARTGKGGDPGDADAALRALMSRASTDEIAARTVLQAVIPGLVSVVRRVGARENPDLEAEVATPVDRTDPANTRSKSARCNNSRGRACNQGERRMLDSQTSNEDRLVWSVEEAVRGYSPRPLASEYILH
jgi:hypothetical protein